MKRLNIYGKRFGRLTVLREGPRQGSQRTVVCKCQCGGIKTAYVCNLTTGKTQSCGCFHKEMASKAKKTHGKTKTIEHKIWSNLRARCNCKGSGGYYKYGARGIKVCDRWNSFEDFLDDMGLRPSPEYSIERVDNEGPYSPENCIWATRLMQANNKRNNRFLELDHVRMTLSQWAREICISPKTLQTRLSRNWSVRDVLTTPLGQTRRIA